MPETLILPGMTGLPLRKTNLIRDCGCESPQVKFFKLKSQFTDEKEVVIVGFSLVTNWC